MTSQYVAYVGTYTRERGVGIHIYDVVGHTLVEKKVEPVHNPSALCVSKDGKHLYSIADEGVIAFEILEDGTLGYINEQWTGGMRGCSITIDSQKRLLFIAGYYDGTVIVVRINEDGSVGEVSQTVYHKGLSVGIAERGYKPEVDCVKLTPDERFLLATDSGLDRTNVYEIDYEAGKIREVSAIRSNMGSAPRKLAFGADYRFLYVLCQLRKCVDVYAISNQTEIPTFEQIQTITTVLPDDGQYCAASSIKISRDGTFMICSNSGANSVAIFNIDKDTGMLSDICNMKISGSFPKTLGIFPDGEHFVTLNQETNEMVTFRLNREGKYFLMDGRPVKVENPNYIWFHKLRDEAD